MTQREQWFIERIGKRVYRNMTSCDCFVCENVYKNGLVIADEDHAKYIKQMEAMNNQHGLKLKYFDERDQMLEFEKSLIERKNIKK